jgi:50S ribosomal protein L16 3-hydroxylase
MNTDQPLALLGGLSPKTFMQRHWQKKPLVIRQAIADFDAPIGRADLVELAAQEEVQSRLIVQNTGGGTGPAWTLRHGPFTRKALPAFNKSGWTLLVQGVDLLDERIHTLMNQFRFVPDARLDDVMISYASDGGGVGPHFDSYDVFLLQAQGQRRWRIGRQKDLELQPGMPLKVLAQFEPEEEFVLNAGDMLYLPPKYAHDGVAVGECMTYSIGFRSPSRGELAGELLQRIADDAMDLVGSDLYRDAKQSATPACAAIPQAMVDFARQALVDALKDPLVMQRVLGEYLSEPKPHVSFEGGFDPVPQGSPVRLDRRTRMLYDEHHVFINGEGFRASGRDAQTMRALADTRCLSASECKRLSVAARELMADWIEAGWIHADE